MSRLKLDGAAEPVSRDPILRRERVRGNIHFPCSADHEQDWQPYPVDPHSCYMYDHMTIHTYATTLSSPNTLYLHYICSTLRVELNYCTNVAIDTVSR